MNHFEQILCQGQSMHHPTFHQNQQIYDKSTNQSNLISTAIEHVHSPFDSSPKASMFFFSLNSPRQNTDNFQFNNQTTHYRKNSRDHIQPIMRRLQFQEDASLFCEEQDAEQQQQSIKQEEQWNFQYSSTPEKNKKIKKTKNSKGLKNLSIGVYQIVAQKKITTYKQVANVLIEKLNKRVKQQLHNDDGYELVQKVQKDQHNIKRRVYDALNVLISAQLLRKQGKRVICNLNLQKEKGDYQQLLEQYTKASMKIKQKQQNLLEKQHRLQNLQKKHSLLSLLIQKNKQLGCDYVDKIKLPFISVKVNMQQISLIDIGRNDIEIKNTKNILILGDIDTIQQLEEDRMLTSL